MTTSATTGCWSDPYRRPGLEYSVDTTSDLSRIPLPSQRLPIRCTCVRKGTKQRTTPYVVLMIITCASQDL